VADKPGILFVHPHPDDESIACGGTIALALDAGHPVTILTCTGGEAGENLGGIELGGLTLAQVRALELASSLEILGGPEHEWLGYRDSGMAETPDNEHADCFHVADLDQAAAQVADLIRRWRPAVVVSDDEHGTYGHPDHIKANAVTRRAVELAADPTWGVGGPWQVKRRFHHALGKRRMLQGHNRLIEEGLASPFGDQPFDDPDRMPFGADDEAITTVIDVSSVLDRKRQAIHAHASQLSPDSFFLNIPLDAEAEFFGVEEFVLVEGEASQDIASSLLAGL